MRFRWFDIEVLGGQDSSRCSGKPPSSFVLFSTMGEEGADFFDRPPAGHHFGLLPFSSLDRTAMGRYATNQPNQPIFFYFETIRGIAWRTKTTTRGQAFGCLTSGFLSRGSHTWVLVFLRAFGPNLGTIRQPPVGLPGPQIDWGLGTAAIGPALGTHALCRCPVLFASGPHDTLEANCAQV